MPKLRPVKWQALVRRFQALGFEGPFGGSKHPYMVKGDLVVTIPNPHREQISVPGLASIRFTCLSWLEGTHWKTAQAQLSPLLCLR